MIQGGKRLSSTCAAARRSSPAHLICMIAAAMGGKPFGYPAGVFVHNDEFSA